MKTMSLNNAEEIEISKNNTPEFYLLYQQSILLSLKEQGVLNEAQYGYCLDLLSGHVNNVL